MNTKYSNYWILRKINNDSVPSQDFTVGMLKITWPKILNIYDFFAIITFDVDLDQDQVLL